MIESTPEAPLESDPVVVEDDAWSTGDARVDAAVARLDDLDERGLHDQADVYDAIHRDLADVLDDASSRDRGA